MNSIYIYMTDGAIDTWQSSEFTDYDIRKELFFCFQEQSSCWDL